MDHRYCFMAISTQLRRIFVAVAVLLPVLTLSPGASAPPARALDNTPWTTPTVPSSCSTTQTNTGNVAGCVVMGGGGIPELYGWPTPPFPTAVAGQAFPPVGWTWNGYTYNGSPALVDWERRLVSNATAIGGMQAGKVVMMPEAWPLFDGFLREVEANGYHFAGGSAYSFRCTTSSVASCSGQTRSRLSNHSYGLAIDINSTKNPVRSYYGINGATACATPMVTDIPRWVVQTAEKWGIYWGGYGWSSGCTSPAQQKSSASRDPTHFEFRGSVDQARVIYAYNSGRQPTLCVAVVNDAGVASQRCLYPGELLPAGTRVVVSTAAPTGATSALVNITALGATQNGSVTAEACTAVPAGARSTVNNMVMASRVMGNVGIVRLDSGGKFCLYLSTATQVIVDVQGFFTTPALAADSLAFTPSTAGRVLDTRRQQFCTPDGACADGPVPPFTETAINVPGAPSGAAATFVNLAMVESVTAGYTTAERCDLLTPGAQATSNLNPIPGLAVSNLSIVRSSLAGSISQLCAMSVSQGQLIVDAQGFFAPPGPGSLNLVDTTAQRLIDTNGCWTDPVTNVQRCGQINPAGSITRVRAPSGAAAVVINIVTSGAATGGYITALPCSAMVAGPQATSNSNYGAGTVSSNLAIVPVDANGLACFYNHAAVHLAIDLQASFSASGSLRYLPIAPTRRLDTRAPAYG